MADKTLTGNEKGNFHDLMVEAVDPSDIDEQKWFKDANGKDSDKPNPRFGKPKFLSRTLYRRDDGSEYWEAKGKDGKVYTVEEDGIDPANPRQKKGKMVIK